MILGMILAEEGHQNPGKALAGDDSVPRQDPCRATRQGPRQGRQQGHCQAHTNQASTIVRMQLPAQPAGRHLRGNMQLPGQLSKRLRGGMQIFVKTLPPRHLSCLPTWHRMRRWPGRVSK